MDPCFTNPCTSEMRFVTALDRVEGRRSVLGLFEGVVTGAADGYFRMNGTPASTLLHLGPGLAPRPCQFAQRKEGRAVNDDFVKALAEANAEPGPRLIEVQM